MSSDRPRLQDWLMSERVAVRPLSWERGRGPGPGRSNFGTHLVSCTAAILLALLPFQVPVRILFHSLESLISQSVEQYLPLSFRTLSDHQHRYLSQYMRHKDKNYYFTIMLRSASYYGQIWGGFEGASRIEGVDCAQTPLSLSHFFSSSSSLHTHMAVCRT